MKHFQIFMPKWAQLCSILIALVGCAPQQQSASLYVAAEVESFVEGGQKISTEAIGTVYLGPPLLHAEYVGQERIYISDVTFVEDENKPFLLLSPQMFLQFAMRSEESKGMSVEAYLKQLESDELQPGKSVYLVAETEDAKIVHKLKIGYSNDSKGVFLLYPFQGYPTQSMRNSNQFEIRELLDQADEDATEVQSWNKSPNELLHVGDPLFPIGRVQVAIENSLRLMERSDLRVQREKDGVQAHPIYSDIWSCKPVIATWVEDGNLVGEKAYLWPSSPGLHIEIESIEELHQIRNDFKRLKYSGFYKSTEGFFKGNQPGSQGSL